MATRLPRSTFAVAIITLLSPGGGVGAALSPAADQFVGTTPCDAQARTLVGIAPDIPCDNITWQLALSGPAATYTIAAQYGVQKSSGQGLENGGSSARLHGSLSTAKGTNTDPNAIVYRLTDASSGRSAAFAKIGENLLHLLNDDNSLAVGNSSWSYTLSRTAPVRGHDLSAHSAPETSVASNAARVFEGRTPCRELARELGVPTPDDCFKLKWRLTLLQDSANGAPTTYKLEGTLYRSRPLAGKWMILEDARANRIVYRLDLQKPPSSLSFLKADANILFFLDATGAFRIGNDAFSYTLNRSAETP